MLVLDGSQGEGGGQILRTALALSLATGQAHPTLPALLSAHEDRVIRLWNTTQGRWDTFVRTGRVGHVHKDRESGTRS